MSFEKFLSEYHFFLDGEAFSPALKAKKDRIHDFHASLLLASMTKEFTSKHRNIWVQPLLRLVRFSLRVECVAPMNADESFSIAASNASFSRALMAGVLSCVPRSESQS
jgi:hypothetical protein